MEGERVCARNAERPEEDGREEGGGRDDEAEGGESELLRRIYEDGLHLVMYLEEALLQRENQDRVVQIEVGVGVYFF